MTHDTKVVDAQVRAMEKYGINPVVIFGDRQAQVDKLIRETKPNILIEDRHGAMWDSDDSFERTGYSISASDLDAGLYN